MSDSGGSTPSTDSSTRVRSRGSLRIGKAEDLLVQRPIRAAYNREGAVVEDSLRLWGLDGKAVDPVPAQLEDRGFVQAHDEEVIWGGYLATHYGHFLTEGASRLWPLLPGAELTGRPVVFIAPWRRPSFTREWLAAFGVSPVELPIDGAIRFKHMYLPEPAWRLNGWVVPEIRDIHLHARQGLDVPSTPGHEVLWLSRSELQSERMAYDECLLEWLLRDQVSCIHPESLSLAEQVGMIEASSVVAGIIGSAFHTLLLAQSAPQCLYLCPSKVASAYLAQSQLLDVESKFIGVLEPAEVNGRGAARFPSGYRVMIPEVLNELATTVLPGLFQSPGSERILRSVPGMPSRSFSKVDLDEAIAIVAHNPYSIDARLRLGELFKAEGNERCAREQFLTATDMSDRA